MALHMPGSNCIPVSNVPVCIVGPNDADFSNNVEKLDIARRAWIVNAGGSQVNNAIRSAGIELHITNRIEDDLYWQRIGNTYSTMVPEAQAFLRSHTDRHD
eukprot:scaffold144810_cov35-Attheya_sp.AAC.1